MLPPPARISKVWYFQRPINGLFEDKMRWLLNAGLPVRAINALWEKGYDSPDELQASTIMDIVNMPGCNRITAMHVAQSFSLSPFDFDDRGSVSPFSNNDIPFLKSKGNKLDRAPYVGYGRPRKKEK